MWGWSRESRKGRLTGLEQEEEECHKKHISGNRAFCRQTSSEVPEYKVEDGADNRNRYFSDDLSGAEREPAVDT